VRWWKILGLAGLAGVAATGAVTVHAERRRRAYTPEEIRDRLHERVAAGTGAAVAPPAAPVDEEPAASRTGAVRERLRALLGRLRLRGRR
jgi:hypothetical protein